MCFCGRHNRQEGQFFKKQPLLSLDCITQKEQWPVQTEKGVFQLTKYVVKRILLAIVTILIVCGITFFAMKAIPRRTFRW